MPVTHLNFDRSGKEMGRQLARCLSNLKEGKNNLDQVFLTMDSMKATTGATAGDWTYATPQFGFDTDQRTLEAYNELNSLRTQVATINAALTQAFNKFGIF